MRKKLYVLFERKKREDDDPKVLETTYSPFEAKKIDKKYRDRGVWYLYIEDDKGNLGEGQELVDGV